MFDSLLISLALDGFFMWIALGACVIITGYFADRAI